MAERIVDEDGNIDFIDEDGNTCFVDEDGNFTCQPEVLMPQACM